MIFLNIIVEFSPNPVYFGLLGFVNFGNLKFYETENCKASRVILDHNGKDFNSISFNFVQTLF